MTRRPNDRQVIARALELLHAGFLVSNLPEQLIDELGLTPERAKELTDKAIKLHKKPGKRGKLDTRPIDKPGE